MKINKIKIKMRRTNEILKKRKEKIKLKNSNACLNCILQIADF